MTMGWEGSGSGGFRRMTENRPDLLYSQRSFDAWIAKAGCAIDLCLTSQSTRRPVQIEITSDTRASLLAWLERWVAASTITRSRAGSITKVHLSTRQYARLLDEWVAPVGLRPEDYGTCASAHHGRSDLQGDRQSARHPDIAWTHQDRKHRFSL